MIIFKTCQAGQEQQPEQDGSPPSKTHRHPLYIKKSDNTLEHRNPVQRKRKSNPRKMENRSPSNFPQDELKPRTSFYPMHPLQLQNVGRRGGSKPHEGMPWCINLCGKQSPSR